jgi:hypothetical protein
MNRLLNVRIWLSCAPYNSCCIATSVSYRCIQPLDLTQIQWGPEALARLCLNRESESVGRLSAPLFSRLNTLFSGVFFTKWDYRRHCSMCMIGILLHLYVDELKFNEYEYVYIMIQLFEY